MLDIGVVLVDNLAEQIVVGLVDAFLEGEVHGGILGNLGGDVKWESW